MIVWGSGARDQQAWSVLGASLMLTYAVSLTVQISTPSVIDILGSYQPTVDILGSYQPAIDLVGSYQPVIDLTGSYQGE